MLGRGHATIVAPSQNPWPLIYRSDLSHRGTDERIKVGVKDLSKFEFYHINAANYQFFNKILSASGYTDNDIGSKFIEGGTKDIERTTYDVDTDRVIPSFFKKNPKFDQLFKQ